jgi:uncharacterized protein (DUF488 family)
MCRLKRMPHTTGISLKNKEFHTVGHSTRSFEEFLVLLNKNGIGILVDIRRFPNSKRNPSFNRDCLEKSLPDAGIEYNHLEALGGRREAKNLKNENAGWRSSAFHAYADHMATDEFWNGIKDLERIENRARKNEVNVTVMCAEAVPWRCHRMLLSDLLVANNFAVKHIVSELEPSPHKMTPFAKTKTLGGRILVYYPKLPQAQQSLC